MAEYKATVDTQVEDPTTSAPDVAETHEEKQDTSADS